MTVAAADRPPTWYRVVAVLAVVWMLIGVLAWIADLRMDPAALAQLSDAQQQLYAARPGWVFAVYAVAIFSGLAGAVGLLLRRRWATPALAVSLAAVVAQFGYTIFGMRAVELLGAGTALPFPLTIVAIGALLLWFSVRASRRGWLGERPG